MKFRLIRILLNVEELKKKKKKKKKDGTTVNKFINL